MAGIPSSGEPDLAAILANVPDVVIRYAPDGTVLWASPSLAEAFGIDPAQAIGQRLHLADGQDFDVVRDEVMALVAAHADHGSVRHKVQHADGRTHWVDTHITFVWAADASLDSTVATMRDVTLEVSQRESLRASIDAQFDPYLRCASTRNSVGRITDLRIEDANPAACKYLHVSRAELLGQSPRALFQGEASEALFGLAIAVLETGVPEVIDDLPVFSGVQGHPVRLDVRMYRVGEAAGISWRDATARYEAADAMADAREHFQMVAENAGDFVTQGDAEGVFEWVSPSVTESIGWLPADVIGRSGAEFVHPDDVADVHRMQALVNGGSTDSGKVRVRCSDGTYRWMVVRMRPVRAADDSVLTRVTTFRDVDEEHRAHRQLEQSERRFRLAMESSPVGMAVVDLDRHFVDVNPALCRLLDCDRDWLLGRRMTDLLSPTDAALDEHLHQSALADDQQGELLEMRLIRPDGREAWVEHSVGVVRDEDGVPVSYVSQFVDIDAAHAARELLKFQATHDSLTRLANRRELNHLLAGALTRSPDPGDQVGVLFIDLDDLKTVNDSFGHAVGDALLTEVAARISRQVRGTDTVARVGGDEFVVMLPMLHKPADAETIADKILRSFETHCRAAGHDVLTSVSIGVTVANPGDDPRTALDQADRALYAAKAAGKGRVVAYDSRLHDRTPATAARLRAASPLT